MQKKKKKQELMEIWTNLKTKLMTTIMELKAIKEHGFEAVHHSSQINVLETKLEKIRNLVADNQLEKLKRMMKKGEI